MTQTCFVLFCEHRLWETITEWPNLLAFCQASSFCRQPLWGKRQSLEHGAKCKTSIGWSGRCLEVKLFTRSVSVFRRRKRSTESSWPRPPLIGASCRAHCDGRLWNEVALKRRLSCTVGCVCFWIDTRKKLLFETVWKSLLGANPFWGRGFKGVSKQAFLIGSDRSSFASFEFVFFFSVQSTSANHRALL